MLTPTNVGYALIRQSPTGDVMVLVCTGVANDKPIDVTAVHRVRKGVNIDPSVRMVSSNSITYSQLPVHVYADDTGVHIRPAATDEGPLMRSLPSS
jgi:hypothetical protein